MPGEKIKIILLITLLVVSLAVFIVSEYHKSTGYYISYKPNFKAYVISKKDNYITVRVKKDDCLYKEYQFLEVSLNIKNRDGAHDNPIIGQEIRIYYDGNIVDDRVDNVYLIFRENHYWFKDICIDLAHDI